jgi:hypothetical protein
MQAACTHGRSGWGVNGGGGLRVTTSGAVQGRQLTKVGGLSMQRGQRLVVAVVIARRLLLRRTLLLLLLVLLLSLLLLNLLLLSLLLLVLRMLRVLLLSLLLLLLVMGRVAREGRKVGGLRHVGGGGVLVLHVEAVNDVVVGEK